MSAPAAQKMSDRNGSERNLKIKQLRRENSMKRRGETQEEWDAKKADLEKKLDQERIIFFGRKIKLHQRFLLGLVTVFSAIFNMVTGAGTIPGLTQLSPFKQLKRFMIVRWKMTGASFHGKKLAFHCTFGEFWMFWATELFKTITTCGCYALYHQRNNSMLMEHFLDSRIGWEDQEWDPSTVEPHQRDFVIFRAEAGMKCKKRVWNLCVYNPWCGFFIACCCIDAALSMVREEVNMLVIGGQTFNIQMKATEKDSACCTKFHKMYMLKWLCPICSPADRYNLYLDDHLEWDAGTENIKQKLIMSGNVNSRRISKFALAGTPFSAKQRQSLAEKPGNQDAIAEAELSEVVVQGAKEKEEGAVVANEAAEDKKQETAM